MENVEFSPVPLEILEGDVAKVLSYWQDLSGEREMPSWREFDLMKVPYELLRTTHVVDIEENAGDFKVRFWGTGSTEILDQELTGKYLSEMRPQKLGQLAVISVKHLAALRKPVAVSTTLKSRDKPEKFQVILRLPLSDTGERVTHAVTVVEYPRGRYHSRDAFSKYQENG